MTDTQYAVDFADAVADNSTVAQMEAIHRSVTSTNPATLPNREAVEAFVTRLAQHLARRNEAGI
jgi:hypothetical protein